MAPRQRIMVVLLLSGHSNLSTDHVAMISFKDEILSRILRSLYSFEKASSVLIQLKHDTPESTILWLMHMGTVYVFSSQISVVGFTSIAFCLRLTCYPLRDGWQRFNLLIGCFFHICSLELGHVKPTY